MQSLAGSCGSASPRCNQPPLPAWPIGRSTSRGLGWNRRTERSGRSNLRSADRSSPGADGVPTAPSRWPFPVRAPDRSSAGTTDGPGRPLGRPTELPAIVASPAGDLDHPGCAALHPSFHRCKAPCIGHNPPAHCGQLARPPGRKPRWTPPCHSARCSGCLACRCPCRRISWSPTPAPGSR